MDDAAFGISSFPHSTKWISFDPWDEVIEGMKQASIELHTKYSFSMTWYH